MPRHDLVCTVCGTERPDTLVPLRALPEPELTHGFLRTQVVDFPLCCGTPMTYRPPRVALDTFTPFTTDVLQPDGSHASVTIDSLATLRKVERETARRARNGEGQAMIWRDYSQDRSNFDVHTMGPPPAPPLSPEAKRRFGGALRSAVEPDVALGPGVTEATASALPESPSHE